MNFGSGLNHPSARRVAGSTISTTVRDGARVRWTTPCGDDHALARRERVRALGAVGVADVEQQRALEHEEQLVLEVVLVPVKLAVEHADARDARR